MRLRGLHDASCPSSFENLVLLDLLGFSDRQFVQVLGGISPCLIARRPSSSSTCSRARYDGLSNPVSTVVSLARS